MTETKQVGKDKAAYRGCYPEIGAGGFTRLDGTIQFYIRVHAISEGAEVVLDFGAGRGRSSESASFVHRKITDLRGDGRRVIGLDVDSAVLENPRLDERFVFDGGKIPLNDASIDVIVCDHVLEHLCDPETISTEFFRVLKPGGWLCARTPYSFSLMVFASRMIPNRRHHKFLERVQPGQRAAKDVFPTAYKLNTKSQIARWFSPSRWENFSYTWSPEPAYHFGSSMLIRLLGVYQYLKRPLGGEVLLVFLQKRGGQL